MNLMTRISVVFATVLVLFSSVAANAVLNMGSKTIFSGTVIEVLEPGPDLQDIIDNITDASATKPYLIHLGAGVYDLGSTQIVMKEYISLAGSGQHATTITSAVIGTDGLFTGAVVRVKDNTSLTDMTIKNTGGGTHSMGVYVENASPRIERITVDVSGGTNRNIGIKNVTASTIMMNITATASGNTNTRGVVNDVSSSTIMIDITASASGGTESNFGVLNKDSSSATMINVTATGSGGTFGRGVYFVDNSSGTMVGVSATGSGGSTNSFGVFSTVSSSPFIQDSILTGDTKGLRILSDSPGTRVVNSKIIGGALNDATVGTQCRGNYDSSLADVSC